MTVSRKVTIVLHDENLAYVDREAARTGKANRSGFINSILADARRRALEAELEAAYRKDAGDSSWVEEAEAWNGVVGDGIDA